MRRLLTSPLVVALAILSVSQSYAGVFKCQGPDGRMSFQSKPCAADQRKLSHKLSAEEKAYQRQQEEEAERKRIAEEERRARLKRIGLDENATFKEEVERSHEILSKQYDEQTKAARETEARAMFDDFMAGIERRHERESLEEVNPKEEQPPLTYSLLGDTVTQVEDHLKKTLHDPRSLEFEEWSPVYRIMRYTSDADTNRRIRYEYLVPVKYRAKNTLGAYVLKYELFVIDETGHVVRSVEVDGRHLAEY